MVDGLHAQITSSNNNERVIFKDMPTGFGWGRTESDTLKQRRWWYLQVSGLHPDSVHAVLWCLDPKVCLPGLSVNGVALPAWQDSVLVMENNTKSFLFDREYKLLYDPQYHTSEIYFTKRPTPQQLSFIVDRLNLPESTLRINNFFNFSSLKTEEEIEKVVRNSFYLPSVRRETETEHAD